MHLRLTSPALRTLLLTSIAACGGGDETSGTDSSSDTTAGPTNTSVTQSDPTTDDTTVSTTVSTTMADTSTGTDSMTTEPSTSTTGDESSSTGDDTGPIVPPCPYDAVDAPTGWELVSIAEGLNDPMFAIGHPTEPDRLFVLERAGTIVMIEPGTTTPAEPDILTIDDVENGGESGLFGLAFHPDFPDDPRIYVNYVAPGPRRTKIVEYTVDPMAGYIADSTSARIILEIDQPEFNHNGGGIAFDPDGWLVIGMGDGGTQATSRNNGVLLAKFLRIGVEPDDSPDDTPACEGCESFGPFDYTIPPDNPFVGQQGYAQEIYALGFRNPWRWSFDVATGDLWVGDVGQSAWEEVDFVEAGRDYGWNAMEGFECYSGDCDDNLAPNAVNADGLSMPLFATSQDGGDCSVIAGAVYRSCEVPEWDGTFLFADYCNPDVRGLRWDGNNVDSLGVLIDANNGITGNGWNNWGDVFFVGGSVNGRVWRIAPTTE
jgi:glucose/arabinose dehydrogenase